MSQIDLRQDRPTSSAAHVPANGKKAVKARRYVEGESDDDEGEIEDVVLGPSGDFDDGDEDDSDALDEDDLDSAFEDEEDGAGSSKPRRKVSSAFLFSKSRI